MVPTPSLLNIALDDTQHEASLAVSESIQSLFDIAHFALGDAAAIASQSPLHVRSAVVAISTNKTVVVVRSWAACARDANFESMTFSSPRV